MRRGIVFLMLFLVAITPAHGENKINIMAPKHGTRVFEQTIWLVMSTTVHPKDMTIVLKNKGAIKNIKGKGIKKGGRFVFHVLLNLLPGLNEVKVQDKTVSVFYESRYGLADKSKERKRISQKYPLYLFHTKQNETGCAQCHKIDKIDSAETASQPACLKCHADLISAEYLHGPLGGGACFVCHDPQSAPTKFAPKFGGEGDLCFGCHQESKSNQSEAKNLHGPVGVNQCTVCHDPHASPFRYQLVRNEKQLCYLCHDKKRIIGGRVVHKPMRYKGCVQCHEPHASDHNVHLVEAEQALCGRRECHPRFAKITKNHPIMDHPVTGPRDPLRPEKSLTCCSCHDPHSSMFPSLLPAEKYVFCSKCHRT